MEQKKYPFSGYILAAGMGAVCGGILVAAFTRAVPKMMSQMMASMMAEISSGECDPAEF